VWHVCVVMHVCVVLMAKAKCVPHTHLSDLLCVCYVLLFVPSYQHNKERNYPCQLCDHKASTAAHLNRHVLSQVQGKRLCVPVTNLLTCPVCCCTCSTRGSRRESRRRRSVAGSERGAGGCREHPRTQ
jgi:hypothetical protein